MNNLIPQSGTKTQRLARKNCLVLFALSTALSRVLRDEMLLLFQGMFHTLVNAKCYKPALRMQRISYG